MEQTTKEKIKEAIENIIYPEYIAESFTATLAKTEDNGAEIYLVQNIYLVGREKGPGELVPKLICPDNLIVPSGIFIKLSS